MRANLTLNISCGYSKQEPLKSIQHNQFKYDYNSLTHRFRMEKKKSEEKKGHTVTHDLDVMLQMLYGKTFR